MFLQQDKRQKRVVSSGSSAYTMWKQRQPLPKTMPSSASAPPAAVEMEKPKHNICFEGQHDSASREEAMQAKESQAARMQAEEAREGEHALRVTAE